MVKQRECPVHWDPLEPETVQLPWARDVTLDRCPTCKGVYLDKGEVKRITGHANLDDLLTKHLGLDSDSARICPACGMVMDAEDADRVHVDVCLSCHGVWLDAGELEQLKDRDDAAFDPANFTAEKRSELDRAGLAQENTRKQAFKGFLGRLTGR